MAEAHAINPDDMRTDWSVPDLAVEATQLAFDPARFTSSSFGETLDAGHSLYWMVTDFFARKSKILILAFLTYAALC